MTDPPAPLLGSARRALFERYRRERRQAWVQASGASMQPLIRSGSWMLVDFGAAPRRAGEIIVFLGPETIIAHRLLRLHHPAAPGKLMTKGDGRLILDPPLEPDAVVGVVRTLRSNSHSRAHSFGCKGAGAAFLAVTSMVIGRAAGRMRGLGRNHAQ